MKKTPALHLAIGNAIFADPDPLRVGNLSARIAAAQARCMRNCAPRLSACPARLKKKTS